MKNKTIEVDVAGLCSLTHRCTGCKGESKRCCSSYEVAIKKNELERIVGWIPAATKFCPHLKSGNGYKNVFEKLSPGLFGIDTHEDGLCVFAYYDNKKTSCSLHAVSTKLSMPHSQIKPISCILWPLAIFEAETKILSIHDDAFEFKCNKHRKTENLSLCPSTARIVEIALGNLFKHELEEAANKGLHWTKIPLRGPLASGLWACV